MSPFNDHSKNRILTLVLVLLCLLFLVSLFKNIGYPLFWADESMTAMGGVRVLEFGYPKVHDGKNVFYDLLHPNTSLGIDKKTDAYIGGANWGQYYFAAMGVKLAEMSDDLFTKTGIIRVTFALTGLAGLIILAILGRQFFHTGLSRTGFLTLFVFFELISIPLVLHLREARYYPLTIFLIASTIFVYARYRILKKTGYSRYAMLLVLFLFLLFFTFSPAYFIFISSLVIFESVLLAGQLGSGHRDQAAPATFPARKALFRDWLRNMLPSFISLVFVSPLLAFFKTFHIAGELAKFNPQLFGIDETTMFWANIEVIWRFFALSDFIYLAILLKLGLLFCFVVQLFNKESRGKSSLLSFLQAPDKPGQAPRVGNPSEKKDSRQANSRSDGAAGMTELKSTRGLIDDPIINKSLPPFDLPKFALSGFLSIFFIVYFVFIARIPNFLFTRYFIPLQVVLALIIMLDIAVIYNFISQYPLSVMRFAGGFLSVVTAGFIMFNIVQNSNYLKGHLHEMSNQYKGPLDYVIPYIRENYPNPENLVIATNYEETSFMYYLGSRVTVGYVGNNLEQDARTQPDIIVYRKLWMNFIDVFEDFLSRQAYGRISFPVMDYTVNNLPELNWRPPIHHRFRTLETAKEEDKVDMFVRK